MGINALKSAILIGLIGGCAGSIVAVISHYAFDFDIPITIILPIVVCSSAILAVHRRRLNSG